MRTTLDSLTAVSSISNICIHRSLQFFSFIPHFASLRFHYWWPLDWSIDCLIDGLVDWFCCKRRCDRFDSSFPLPLCSSDSSSLPDGYHLNLSPSLLLSHGVWLCNFSWICKRIVSWCVCVCLVLLSSLAGEMHGYLTAWFSRRDWLQRTGVWAAQSLCKVHANWSGSLLHGMMLLERRHRHPKIGYQQCGHPRGCLGTMIECACTVCSQTLAHWITANRCVQKKKKEDKYDSPSCPKTWKHDVVGEIIQCAGLSHISGSYLVNNKWSQW